MKPVTMNILEAAAKAHECRSLAEPHALHAALLLAAGRRGAELNVPLTWIDVWLRKAAEFDGGWEDG